MVMSCIMLLFCSRDQEMTYCGLEILYSTLKHLST